VVRLGVASEKTKRVRESGGGGRSSSVTVVFFVSSRPRLMPAIASKGFGVDDVVLEGRLDTDATAIAGTVCSRCCRGQPLLSRAECSATVSPAALRVVVLVGQPTPFPLVGPSVMCGAVERWGATLRCCCGLCRLTLFDGEEGEGAAAETPGALVADELR
jgi:hypothetical protein